jgi:hypothetical protein
MLAPHSTRLAALVTVFSALLLAACSTPKPPAPAPQAAPRATPAPAPAPAAVVVQPAPPPVVYAPAPAPVTITKKSEPTPSGPITSAGAAALREGIASYQKRDYRTAEAKLALSQQQGLSQLDDVLQAYKHQAFIYCLSKRTVKCEEAFTEALSLDRSFDLSSTERRNPAWAASFAKVRNRMRK